MSFDFICGVQTFVESTAPDKSECHSTRLGAGRCVLASIRTEHLRKTGGWVGDGPARYSARRRHVSREQLHGGADTGAEGEIDGARCQVDGSTESLHRPANRVLPVTRRGNRAIAQNFEMREYDLSTRQRAGARKVRGSLHRDRPVSGSLGGGERAASTTGAEQRIGGCFATNCHTEEREAKGERTQV